MQNAGFEVIEYSNEGSESEAKEKVVILDTGTYNHHFPKVSESDFVGNRAVIDSPGHAAFEERLIPALRERLAPEDIICHPFGHAHQRLLSIFPGHQHVETGIGYSTLMPGSYKIYESYAWMHYHQGKEIRNGINYEWVVPNYFDLSEWTPKYDKGDYLAFLGRITKLKGLDTILALADHSPLPIKVCGQGDPSPWKHPKIEFLPPISGRKRSDFLRNAYALLAPSTFTEPFCGMSVEAMLCGTPVISVDYGAMTETVQEGMGYRCHTLQDWLDSIENVGGLDREAIANEARSKYSIEACGQKYKKIFEQLNDLHRKGWYELRGISFNKIELEEKPFSERLAEWVVRRLSPESVLDVGCGPGTYVESFLSRSVKATGIKIDERVEGKASLIRESLFDCEEVAELVLCLEVAEHIEEQESESIVQKVSSFVKSGGYLIWSSAQPGQGGSGHINCQPKVFWEDLIIKSGMARCPEIEKDLFIFMKSGYHIGWFVQNGMVFRKPPENNNVPIF